MHSLGHILPVIWFIAVCASLQALLQLCRNKFICRKLKVIQIITVYRHTNRFCLQEVSTDLFSHWGRGQFCIYEENSFCLLDKWERYSLSHIQLCDPMDSGGGARQTPLSPGILQARILEWAAIPFSRGSPGIESWSPALQADSLQPETPGELHYADQQDLKILVGFFFILISNKNIINVKENSNDTFVGYLV